MRAARTLRGRAAERRGRLGPSRGAAEGRFRVALAKALAKPPVAAELCLPLVEPGGAVVLWLGETADRDPVEEVSHLLGGVLESDTDGIVVLRKVRPTPAGFPRRPGMAKKRPLA